MTPMDAARESVEANLSDRSGVLDGVDRLTRADLVASVTVDCVRTYLQAAAKDEGTVQTVCEAISAAYRDPNNREWEPIAIAALTSLAPPTKTEGDKP